MPEWTRRQLLGVSLGLVGTSAGGYAIGNWQSSDDDPGPLQLSQVGYENKDDSPHTLDITVSIADEIRYWDTINLASIDNDEESSGGQLDIPLPEKSDEYTVIGRVDGEETDQISSDDGLDWSNSNASEGSRCTLAAVFVESGGSVSVENFQQEKQDCVDNSNNE